MVQITTSFIVAFLLVAPSLAAPITNQEEFEVRYDDLAAHDPSFGSLFRKVKKIAIPSNMGKVAKVASLAIRDDTSGVYERAWDDINFEELATRDPGFGSIFRKIKKVVNPKNIGKAAKVASMVIRDNEDLQLSERDLEGLKEVAARDPSFASIFRKVKKVVNPKNIGKVAKVASLVVREEDAELSERDLEELVDLAARDPRFGSIFRKIKKVVNPKNIGKVAKVASMVVRDEDGDVFERDYSDFKLDQLD